jgi:hypothetical protein
MPLSSGLVPAGEVFAAFELAVFAFLAGLQAGRPTQIDNVKMQMSLN